jgi:hypothetical protein
MEETFIMTTTDRARRGEDIFPPAGAVAEIQGLYGPFTFSEKLLQKIWLRGDFDRRQAVMSDGRRVAIVHPGRWNRLGGPDFKAARLRFDDGPERIADVELHLRATDWAAHGHAGDRAYDGVRLHVVLFPLRPGEVTRAGDGREIPVLVLLPLLHHDLEEYATDEAVETLTNRPVARAVEALGALPADELAAVLMREAAARWRQKVHFAGLRIRRLGWEDACHHAALEILGHRFNRAPMLRVAGRRPLARWAAGAVDPETAWADEAEGWSLQGVRPANHPRIRLRQYAGWVRQRPDWPARLVALADRLPAVNANAPTTAMRRAGRLTAWRSELADTLAADAVGGTRFDTLVCDGFWPLLAAQAGGERQGLWFHWFPGDLPPSIRGALRELGVTGGPGRPACHGFAQGLLGWSLGHE